MTLCGGQEQAAKLDPETLRPDRLQCLLHVVECDSVSWSPEIGTDTSEMVVPIRLHESDFANH